MTWLLCPYCGGVPGDLWGRAGWRALCRCVPGPSVPGLEATPWVSRLAWDVPLWDRCRTTETVYVTLPQGGAGDIIQGFRFVAAARALVDRVVAGVDAAFYHALRRVLPDALCCTWGAGCCTSRTIPVESRGRP